LSKNGTLIITSAGGGAEDMLNKKKGENKNYNFAPLPLIITNKQLEGRKMSLEDPADNDLSLIKTQNNLSALYYTILKLLGIAKNKEKGKSLI